MLKVTHLESASSQVKTHVWPNPNPGPPIQPQAASFPSLDHMHPDCSSLKAAGYGSPGFALTFVFHPGPNAQMFTAWPQDQARADVGTNDSGMPADTCTFPEMLVSTSTELHICVHTPAPRTEP